MHPQTASDRRSRLLDDLFSIKLEGVSEECSYKSLLTIQIQDDFETTLYKLRVVVLEDTLNRPSAIISDPYLYCNPRIYIQVPTLHIMPNARKTFRL